MPIKHTPRTRPILLRRATWQRGTGGDVWACVASASGRECLRRQQQGAAAFSL
jgi:hypothetical protein